MAAELLYDLNLWLILLGSIILFLSVTEAGFRLGRRVRAQFSDSARSEIGTIQGAMLGMLALLLGFTFSMALSRFEVRKQLVLEEANAIGTTYLRAQLLPEPPRREISQLLRHYVDKRLDFYEARNDREKLHRATIAAEKMHENLWLQATALGEKDPRSITSGMFIQSLNEVIDLHSKRLTALENHVPEIILLLLYFVGVVAMGLIGYGCGLGERRSFLVTTMAATLIAVVMMVIIDLDRPRRGLIKVSQQRLLDLKGSLKSP